MKLFEGLLFYEIVLLGLGVLLFLVLLFLLIYSIIKKKDIKVLTLFFVISIIMIGYPSIQKIKFDNGVVEIEKRTKELEQNPADATAQQELEKRLAEIEQRPISNPTTFVKLAEAKAAIGDTIKAFDYFDSALKVQPNLLQASRLRRSFDIDRAKAARK
jgi:tetratricopeptide (TPR) repeat protein